jgi:hypothetical protein
MPRVLVLVLAAFVPLGSTRAAAPEMELVLSDELLTAVLRAATPREVPLDQDLGLGGAVKLTVTLSNPSVHVTNAAVKVKVDVRLRDGSGMIDVTGVANPDLRIVPVPEKGLLEARFVRLNVTLPGGVAVPLDAKLDPIALPGVWQTEVSFGDRVVVAEARAVEVVPEVGRARVRGTVTFKPAAKARRP